jgi:hypothetical protein
MFGLPEMMTCSPESMNCLTMRLTARGVDDVAALLADDACVQPGSVGWNRAAACWCLRVYAVRSLAAVVWRWNCVCD